MSNLNLARKLRPKTFDEIIGQQLSVSMLKNSLFLKKLFPVYLFSGQRGCGKTSTARVFASAVNCHTLENFRADAKNHIIPCLTCDSCKAMPSHPDFIEMDAASHTGVDSVRQIIESCTYMPIAGDKKIYLIDEAHMLSKAAFNAFLKILEEPPPSTMFILATTEPQKIPDTVRSRCFQVIFNPVSHNIMVQHLMRICESEQIDAELEAIEILVKENDGSVRDAINKLEQIRFSGEKITKDLVLQSLGHLSDTQLFELMSHIVHQRTKELIVLLKSFEALSPQSIWHSITKMLKAILWESYGVTNSLYNSEQIQKLTEHCSRNKIHALMQLLWTQERFFLQTPQKHLFLETVLIQMCNQVNIADIKTLLQHCKTPQVLPTQVLPTQASQIPTPPKRVSPAPMPQTPASQTPVPPTPAPTPQPSNHGSNNHGLDNAKLNDWSSIMAEAGEKLVKKNSQPETRAPKKVVNPRISTFDSEKWPKAALLTKHFSGKLEKIKK